MVVSDGRRIARSSGAPFTPAYTRPPLRVPPSSSVPVFGTSGSIGIMASPSQATADGSRSPGGRPHVEPEAIVQREVRADARVVLGIGAEILREPLELPAVRRREPGCREPEQQARHLLPAAGHGAAPGEAAVEAEASGHQ